MNAGDDKENVEEEEEASGSSSSDMCCDQKENECCGRAVHGNNSAVCNGARPKTCNIPNGISSSNNYSLKLNNNSLDSEKIHNGNDMDVYMRNNVDCCVSIDKCPPKVRKHVGGGDECKNLRQYRRDEDSLSENEEEEDEYCIYTYKGDENQMADLPSSFFRLGVAAAAAAAPGGPGGRERSRSSSPDMDYLEMDFDPGPSNDRGDSSEDSDCCDMQLGERPESASNEVSPRVDHSPLERDPHAAEDEEEEGIGAVGDTCRSPTMDGDAKNDLNGSGNLAATPSPPPAIPLATHSTDDAWRFQGDRDSPVDPVETTLNTHWSGVVDYLNSQSDSATDAEKYNLRSALYHCIMAKRLVLDKQASFDACDQSNMHLKENLEASSPDAHRPVEKIMIWSEKEASAKQVTQIGTSLCGVTAIVNVLVALNMPFSLDKLKEAVGTRFRREDAPVPEYLLSRCVAGVTHHDIIKAIDIISQGSLYARFFCMHPERSFSLLRWLASWMKKGAIAIATLNLQRGVAPAAAAAAGSAGGVSGGGGGGPGEGGESLPDCWHHQMVFGVGPRGVYMTNPLECVDEATLLLQLTSPSVLRVRRADVLNRWTPATDLTPLTKQADLTWNKMNVLGQVVNIIREEKWNRQGLNRTLTSHISIPASYSSGITLIMTRENPAFDQLVNAPELPVIPS